MSRLDHLAARLAVVAGRLLPGPLHGVVPEEFTHLVRWKGDGGFERWMLVQPPERAVSVRSYGGLGLGLHLVREILTALGGTIRVESTVVGQGTTFILQLPCSGPPPGG